jgi:hypothetical protein
LLCSLSLSVYAGTLEATVDEKEVILGDAVLFTITVVGEESDPLPEMDTIGGIEVDNIMRHKGSDFVYVDGKSVMEHTQSITFEFKPTKDLIIPGFQMSVDGEIKTSNSIHIKVVKLAKGEKRKNKYFSIEVKLNKSKIYLGEAVIATVYLRQKSALDIMSLDYTKPAFKDFFSKQLEGEKKYKEKSYTVYELSYLLTPKREGILKVEPAIAKIAQRVREKQEGGWFANVPKWSNIASDELELNVIKPHEDYDVMGKFSLTDVLDNQTVKANKPINLKIELQGEGSLEDFEGLSFTLDGVTIYSDDAKIESKFEDETLKSFYSKSFAFISDHDFIIPPQQIRMFNPQTGQIKILKTKGYSIKVLGGKKLENERMVHRKNTSTIVTDNKLEPLKYPVFKLNFPDFLILFLTFLLGVFATLFFKNLRSLLERFVPYLSKKWNNTKLGFDGYEALQILYPHMGDSREVEQMVRDLYAIKCGDTAVKINKELLTKLVKQYQVESKN